MAELVVGANNVAHIDMLELTILYQHAAIHNVVRDGSAAAQ